jgi:hypothetical protein
MESSCADAKMSHARMACLEHVLEHLLCPAAAVKVGIKELKEQDQCRQVHAGITIATARNDEAVKNATLGDSRPISSVNKHIGDNVNAKWVLGARASKGQGPRERVTMTIH